MRDPGSRIYLIIYQIFEKLFSYLYLNLRDAIICIMYNGVRYVIVWLIEAIIVFYRPCILRVTVETLLLAQHILNFYEDCQTDAEKIV